MKSVTYNPSRDELIVGSCRANDVYSLVAGRFRIYWDKNLIIRGLAIRDAERQLKEFREALRVVPLGGLLCGVEVTADDIRECRQELLKQVEQDW